MATAPMGCTENAHATVTRHLTASTFVTREAEDGSTELLLVKHAKLGRWMIPGGHVEPNEAPATTAVREVLEETGVDIVLRSAGLTPDIGTVEDVVLVPAPAWIAIEQIPACPSEPAHEHIDLLFLGTMRKATAQLSESARWFKLHELPVHEMFPGTLRLAQVVASVTPVSAEGKRVLGSAS